MNGWTVAAILTGAAVGMGVALLVVALTRPTRRWPMR